MRIFYLTLLALVAGSIAQKVIHDDLSDFPDLGEADFELNIEFEDNLNALAAEDGLFSVGNKAINDLINSLFGNLRVPTDNNSSDEIVLFSISATFTPMDDNTLLEPSFPKLERKNAMTPEEIEAALQEIDDEQEQEASLVVVDTAFVEKIIDKFLDLPTAQWLEQWVDTITVTNSEMSLEKAPPSLLNFNEDFKMPSSVVDFNGEMDSNNEEKMDLKQNRELNQKLPTKSTMVNEEMAFDSSSLDLNTVDDFRFAQVNKDAKTTGGYEVYLWTLVIFAVMAVGMKVLKDRKSHHHHSHHHHEDRASDYVEINTN